MKKVLFPLMVAMLTAFTVCFLPFCSKDDEPESYEPTYDGVAVYLNAIETLYDSEGKPAFTATTTPGLYIAAAADGEVAKGWIGRLIGNDKWDGKSLTLKLGENGESGSLRIVAAPGAGIFDEVVVDIDGYTPFTLQIMTPERAKDENAVLEDGYTGEGVVTLK